jgi:hypothetical protein
LEKIKIVQDLRCKNKILYYLCTQQNDNPLKHKHHDNCNPNNARDLDVNKTINPKK